MYIRITIKQQQTTLENLELLKSTLADEVDFSPCYKKENGKIESLPSLGAWIETH